MLASEPSGDFLPDLGPARKAFVESLYDRIPFLDANVSCLNSATLSPEECATVLENIRGILHKIAGTAGTLGYSNEGQQAEALEIAIHIKKNNLYGDDVLTVWRSELTAQLEVLLDDLEAILDAWGGSRFLP